MADPLRLYGLKALVTNAADGIGEASARTLVKHGARVLAVDDINSGVEQHFASVRGISGMASNVSDAGNMAAVVDTAAAELGGLDIVVNDFPVFVSEPLDDDERLAGLMTARQEQIKALAAAAMPSLQRSPAGRLINVGMVRSLFAAGAEAAFSRAEQELAALTRQIGADAGESGVTANYVQPGAIMTPVSRELFRKDTTLRDVCIAGSAARRLGEPIDVAKVVLFLASEDAAFVNGAGIAVDGGTDG
ncbi:MAG: SDR family oxidoreductase [Pseudomonadota bacterium]